jgi:hypothetical protein
MSERNWDTFSALAQPPPPPPPSTHQHPTRDLQIQADVEGFCASVWARKPELLHRIPIARRIPILILSSNNIVMLTQIRISACHARSKLADFVVLYIGAGEVLTRNALKEAHAQ